MRSHAFGHNSAIPDLDSHHGNNGGDLHPASRFHPVATTAWQSEAAPTEGELNTARLRGRKIATSNCSNGISLTGGKRTTR
jgi:hypothetical protein